MPASTRPPTRPPKAPFPWYGGKQYLADTLARLLPPHRVYVEVFGGAASLLFTKPASSLEVYNDVDSGLVHFFRVLRDPTLAARLTHQLDLTPYAREEWSACVRTCSDETADDVERARRYFVAITGSFGKHMGSGTGWSYSATSGHDKAHAFRSATAQLTTFTARLRYVQIEHQDFAPLIAAYDAPHTLFYCLAPGSLVRTLDERFIPIERVREGDMLAPGRAVQHVWAHHHRGNLLAISVQGMPDAVRVTPEHRFLRISKRQSGRQDHRTQAQLWNQREIVPAGELQIGDYLLVPLGGSEAMVQWIWDDTPRKQGIRKIGLSLTCCPELYRLIGYYAAEGHIQRSNGHPIGVILSFCEDEADTWVRDVVRCCEKAFGITPDIRPGPSTSAHVHQVCIWSTTIAQFVAHYVDGLALTKSLHPALLTAPRDSQLELLKGWLRGDGGLEVSSRNRCKLVGTSASEQLARDMHLLALRCGLRPSFKRRRGNYAVYFASEDAKTLGWNVPAQRFRSTRRIISNHMLVRVRNVCTEEYDGPVYDIDVDGDNLFGVPYVLTHNCDPPYVPATRTRNDRYRHEMTLADHERLLAVLTTVRGIVLLSGYRCALYDTALVEQHGWRRSDFPTHTWSANRRRERRIECLWMNPAARLAQPTLFADLSATAVESR